MRSSLGSKFIIITIITSSGKLDSSLSSSIALGMVYEGSRRGLLRITCSGVLSSKESRLLLEFEPEPEDDSEEERALDLRKDVSDGVLDPDLDLLLSWAPSSS